MAQASNKKKATHKAQEDKLIGSSAEDNTIIYPYSQTVGVELPMGFWANPNVEAFRLVVNKAKAGLILLSELNGERPVKYIQGKTEGDQFVTSLPSRRAFLKKDVVHNARWAPAGKQCYINDNGFIFHGDMNNPPFPLYGQPAPTQLLNETRLELFAGFELTELAEGRWGISCLECWKLQLALSYLYNSDPCVGCPHRGLRIKLQSGKDRSGHQLCLALLDLYAEQLNIGVEQACRKVLDKANVQWDEYWSSIPDARLRSVSNVRNMEFLPLPGCHERNGTPNVPGDGWAWTKFRGPWEVHGAVLQGFDSPADSSSFSEVVKHPLGLPVTCWKLNSSKMHFLLPVPWHERFPLWNHDRLTEAEDATIVLQTCMTREEKK